MTRDELAKTLSEAWSPGASWSATSYHHDDWRLVADAAAKALGVRLDPVQAADVRYKAAMAEMDIHKKNNCLTTADHDAIARAIVAALDAEKAEGGRR